MDIALLIIAGLLIAAFAPALLILAEIVDRKGEK